MSVDQCEVTKDLPRLKETAEGLNLSTWTDDLENWHSKIHGGEFTANSWIDTDLRTLHNICTGYGHVPDERENEDEVVNFAYEVEEFVEHHFECDIENDPCGDGECIGNCRLWV